MSATERDNSLVLLLALLVGAVLLLPALAMGFGMMGFGTMGGMWGGGMWGGTSAAPGWLWVVGLAMPLLFFAVIVGVGYLLVRGFTGGSSDTDRALEELRTAYARGDLSDEEYERRRERLREE